MGPCFAYVHPLAAIAFECRYFDNCVCLHVICYIDCNMLKELTVCIYLDQQSRLIAVSTNLRRITIFAHGCISTPEWPFDPEERIKEDIQAGYRITQKFKILTEDDIVRDRRQNYVSGLLCSIISIMQLYLVHYVYSMVSNGVRN